MGQVVCLTQHNSYPLLCMCLLVVSSDLLIALGLIQAVLIIINNDNTKIT